MAVLLTLGLQVIKVSGSAFSSLFFFLLLLSALQNERHTSDRSDEPVSLASGSFVLLRIGLA